MNGLLIAMLVALVFVVLAFVVFASHADRALSVTPREAQSIMRSNFFDLNDAYVHLGVVIPEDWDRVLRRVPFTREVLEECKCTHVLVAIPPISILQMRTIATTAHFYEDENPWYLAEPFAQEEGKLAWKLIRKTPVEHSTMRSAMDQRTLLREDEVIPTARELVYAILGRYHKVGTHLLEHFYARTLTKDSYGRRVCVGSLGSDGISIINEFHDEGRYPVVGIASARSHEEKRRRIA